jgi:predicted esterase
MSTSVLVVPARTHGRVVVEDAEASSGRLLVTFHGYALSAESALADARQIPGIGAWRIAAVQGLHRFYSQRHESVVASWMTKQDRDVTIADNIAYLDEVLRQLAAPADTIVFAGFSQGASMAYRAAQLCERAAAGVIAVAGDVPPELMAPTRRPWPPIFLAAGLEDPWFTPQKLDADAARLKETGATADICRFSGKHEWTTELSQAAGEWLARNCPSMRK